MKNYRYTESGLDNVIIRGMNFLIDDAGEQIVTIRNVAGLHRAIATAIVQKTVSMTATQAAIVCLARSSCAVAPSRRAAQQRLMNAGRESGVSLLSVTFSSGVTCGSG